ncbi:MAG: S-layer homology domain-containing protein [Oscillospiraceae bacterium]|nr:S-layer homology domain-containing protein [Oscillospiraceae bacterium]
MKKKIMSAVLALALFFGTAPAAFAELSDGALNSAVVVTAKYIYSETQSPQVGSVGGEWAVIGLARSGYDVPDRYYRDYYSTVEQYVTERGGVLHERKYTEYSRVIVALSAIGADARNVGGYDLTIPLGDFDKTVWQGLNGPIWALIALDSRDYPMPENPDAATQATRQMYVDYILDCQLSDGGWSLFGGTDAAYADDTSDPDITGMALQALAKYQSRPDVAKATEEALDCMSAMQQDDGGFSSMGDSNAESIVQMIVGLCELGMSPEDPRFVKNGISMLDALLAFRRSDGGFNHTAGGTGNNQMTAEQGFYALVAAKRQRDGKNSLYRMDDAIDVKLEQGGAASGGTGLPGKHKDVKQVPVTAEGTTFSDIKNHSNKTAIEALASRGIINGMGDGSFAPDANMSRAQFAAITVRALGLEPKANDSFTDVKPGDWFAGYVGTANSYEIVKGVGGGLFSPEGTITRQEAATMVARAAKLCGMETDYSGAAVRDALAQFGDYTKTNDWARASLAFCYDQGILDSSVMNIEPTQKIKRCEIAQMLYNMLQKAKLL